MRFRASIQVIVHGYTENGAIDATIDPDAMTPNVATAQLPEGTARMRIVPSIGTLVLSVLRAISDPFVPTAQLYFLVEDGFKRPSGALSTPYRSPATSTYDLVTALTTRAWARSMARSTTPITNRRTMALSLRASMTQAI